MITPSAIKVMAEYLDASERLAAATEDLIKAHDARRAGLLGNCAQFEEVAAIRLKVYRAARANWENLQ